MKKVLIPTLIASVLFAGEQNYIEIGGGFVKSKDNFSTESSKSISSLNGAKSENNSIANISFLYGYDLNDTTNVYIQSEMGGLNLGTSFETNYGLFDMGLKADLLNEEWKNPFLTTGNREETDTKEFGIYLGYGFNLAENIESMIQYEFSKKTYDTDDVASDLKREGNRHILALDNMLFTNMFNKNVAVLNTLTYEKYNADGKSSSYDQYDFALGLSLDVIEDVNVALVGNIGKKEFEGTNSVVNKKIDASIYGMHAVVAWDKPLGYDNVYTTLRTGYEKEDANHDFYDKENTFGLISLGYRF